jgi:DNA-binding transcriptional LysR family regulator
MTLEQLRIFLAVAEREHMTRAAEALHLTQSAVSAAISGLEARHGVRLFDRLGRRILLTDDGRTFMAEARKVLDQAETAEALECSVGTVKSQCSRGLDRLRVLLGEPTETRQS